MNKYKKKNGVTKVISLKKVLANRANAKMSTGPITFEGKQKVSGKDSILWRYQQTHWGWSPSPN